tara:strand:- start:653 stop:1480 length:828 start_codon:yes stop_codon:yes gene_type:complete
MKILIIGKNSRITQFLKEYLDKNFLISIKSYSELIKKDTLYFEKYQFIINCSSNKKYISSKYSTSNDYDYKIAKKIIKLKTFYIFLSTRKLYKPKINCKEIDKPHPICDYSKNKLITENRLKKIVKNKLIILRISNVIGITKKNSKKKLHKTFIDFFFENIKKGYIIKNQKIFKDFISSKKLGHLISKLIKLKAIGTYNLSIGKKIYLDDIIRWLNFYNPNSFKIINQDKLNFNKDSFYLNNNKILKKTKIKMTISDLKKDCKKISKIYFLENKK